MELRTAVVVGAAVVVDNEETKVDSIGMEVVLVELVVDVVEVEEVVVSGSADHMISSTFKVKLLYQVPIFL